MPVSERDYPHVDPALMARVRTKLHEWFDNRLSPEELECWEAPGESPIEVAFLLAVAGLCQVIGHEYLYIKTTARTLSDAFLIVEPQKNIEGMRVDFLVTFEGHAIVVECDGHEFHERTKAQAERDRSRDRKLQRLGYTVFRFTGREIVRDPVACAHQVLEMLGLCS
jgi:very-short-patch-repair endonuclease